jgi:hypothetical protein
MKTLFCLISEATKDCQVVKEDPGITAQRKKRQSKEADIDEMPAVPNSFLVSTGQTQTLLF